MHSPTTTFKEWNGFPFTPTPDGDVFRNTNDADDYHNREKDPSFIRILVYSGI